MIKYVLDASAVLALINQEQGAEQVVGALPFATMSAINVSEVAAVLNALGFSKEECESTITSLVSEIEPFDEDQAYGTAELRALTRAKGLSLGDRACLNLAKSKNLTVLTSDKIWGQINCGVTIEVIR